VRRLARAEFQAQRRAVLRQAASARDGDDLARAADQALEARHDAWLRFYRRTFATVGAAFARDGQPPKQEQREAADPSVGTSWGPADDPWWFVEFRPKLLGKEPWWDPWLVETLRYAETVGARRVRQIDATTRRQIQRAISEGLAEGEGVDRLLKRIDRLHLEQIIPNRSEVIARTEALNAARAGSFNGTIALGLEDRVTKSWLATGDERTRPEHAEAEAENVDVPFLEPFLVRSPASGAPERLMFPGDASLGAGAANIVQCRCDLIRRLP
jgi:hypothetical protein